MDTMSRFSLKGKNAIITGGGGFLGRQHARALLDGDAQSVWMVDKSAVALERNTSHNDLRGDDRIHCVEADITDEESMATLSTMIDAHAEPLQWDILVNNAGMTVEQGGEDYFAPFEEYSLEPWEAALKNNLTGTFLVTKFVLRNMLKHGRGGVIVNVGSDVGIVGPNPSIYKGEKFNTPLSYSMCKAALIHMTRWIAVHYAKDGIRCNAIAPAGMYNGQDEAFVRKLSDIIPLGRMATEGEYQAALLYLCSDASSFMTGSTLVVDGGRTAW